MPSYFGEMSIRGRKARFAPVAAILLAAAILASLLGAQRARAASVTSSRVSASYEERIVKSINNLRRREGLPRLRLVKTLRRSARVHSLQMVQRGFFGHVSPSGLGAADRIRRFYPSSGFSYWAAGENLLWSQSAIEPWRVAVRWMKSPGHRAVLLSPRWRGIGVGVVRSKPSHGRPVLLVTADFAVRRR